MSYGNGDGSSDGPESAPASRRVGPPRLIWACLVSGAICALSGCGDGGGGAAALPSQIVFASDRSVILPKPGSTYQFVAHAGSGGTITWTSSDPASVSVSATGLVTAVTQTGSATITATAPGVPPAAASVIVAAPGPQTVLVDSADVVKVDGTQATLAVTPATSSIVAGDIVVTGDRAGLIGTVKTASSTPAAITLQIAPASLVQAFPDLSVSLSGAPVTMKLQVTNGRAALLAPDGRTIAVSRAGGGFSCEDSSGHTVSATETGPSFTAPIEATLEASLHATHLSVQDFSLAVNVTIPAAIQTGSVTFVASGETDFTCTDSLPEISIPAVPVGPVDIEGTLSSAAVIKVSANAAATLTLTGPSVSDTFTVDDGISWTRTGGWTAVSTNSSTGLVPKPPGFALKAQAEGKVSGAIRVDAGIGANAADFTLAGADFAFAQVDADLGFTMDSPLLYTTPGYTGPTWSADLDLSAGPQLHLTGGVASLLSYLGVPTGFGEWKAFDQQTTLTESPTPKLTAATSAAATGASDTLTASQPAGYAGSTVQFYAYPTTGAPVRLGSATVDSGGTAAFAWTPAAGEDGTYQIEAFLFGDAFGPADLPYPSAPVSVHVGGGSVTTTIH